MRADSGLQGLISRSIRSRSGEKTMSVQRAKFKIGDRAAVKVKPGIDRLIYEVVDVAWDEPKRKWFYVCTTKHFGIQKYPVREFDDACEHAENGVDRLMRI